MKTLRYLLLGIMLIAFVPLCNSQQIKNKQVITLQSLPANASEKLLSESREILLQRLTLMNVRDARVMKNTAKSELEITVVDTISPHTLSEILLVQGNVRFKADSNLLLTKEDILESHADFIDPGLPTLTITFRENKWKELENMTTRNINKPVAFCIDDKVYSSPRIMAKIPHGKISLTGGGLTQTEVRKLAAIISSGPVPLKFRIVTTE
jgi:preprotein translocase subunit SecD